MLPALLVAAPGSGAPGHQISRPRNWLHPRDQRGGPRDQRGGPRDQRGGPPRPTQRKSKSAVTDNDRMAKGSRRGRLILVDAHSLVYRAYFALPPMSTSSGTVTNAVYGFTS